MASMARPIRVEFEGAVYHVMARGNERQPIFRDDGDRVLFCETVAEMCRQFGVVVHLYCLIPNHYHMAAETPRGNLSQAIGWLQTAYTIRFNRRHGRVGHLFQGRFKAQLVDADRYAQSLVRYVHLNPVRPQDRNAAIPAERAKQLAEYEWSSHL
ncbi:MAG: addiction module toxin RelE, partial [Planctomycetes bacterium]|nr:addiction module toxin RelE [Planctomycetota bacterium]